MQRTTPRSESNQPIGPSAPFRSKSPMTMTHPFFFVEAILTQGAVWINLQPSQLPSLLLFVSTCKTSHLLSQGTWDREIITQETCLLCWAGTCCQCPLSLHPCFQAGGQMTESSLSCVLSAYGICLRECEVQFQCVCSFETTFLHILNLNMDWIGYTVGLEVWNRPWFHFQISLPPMNISVVSEMNLICKN